MMTIRIITLKGKAYCVEGDFWETNAGRLEISKNNKIIALIMLSNIVGIVVEDKEGEE